MKCKHVLQRMLVGSGQLPADAQAHLDDCERCRRWSGRLAEIDALLPQIPVPEAPAAKAALMAQFLAPAAPLPEPVWAPRRLRISWPRVVLAVAAAIVLALAVGGVFNRERRPAAGAAQDAFLARVVDRNLELARAETVEKRVKILAALSNDLDDETRALARVAAADDLKELADLYVAVIGDARTGLVARADEVPLMERKTLVPIADQLKKTGDRADQMAREVPPGAIDPLKRIAASARAAQAALQKKIDEEKVAQDVAAPRRGAKS